VQQKSLRAKKNSLKPKLKTKGQGKAKQVVGSAKEPQKQRTDGHTPDKKRSLNRGREGGRDRRERREDDNDDEDEDEGDAERSNQDDDEHEQGERERERERERESKEHDLSSLLLTYYSHFSRFTILSKYLIIIFMSYYGLAKNRKTTILGRAGGRAGWL
jgi:hypothetical protein